MNVVGRELETPYPFSFVYHVAFVVKRGRHDCFGVAPTSLRPRGFKNTSIS